MDSLNHKRKSKSEKQARIYMNTVHNDIKTNKEYKKIIKLVLTTDKKLTPELLQSIAPNKSVDDFLVKLQNCNLIKYNSYNNTYQRMNISNEFVEHLMDKGVSYEIHSYFLYRLESTQ